MILRRLTDAGVSAFAGFLAELRADPTLPVPTALLEDPAYSNAIPGEVPVDDRRFPSRYAAAEYLYRLLAPLALPDLDRDRGLWTWLTLFYFDQLCPPDGNGRRKVGEDSRYIPNFTNSRRYYRHLLYGAYATFRLYSSCPDVLPVLLSNPMHVATSETFRLFVEHTELLSCPAAVSAANRLYYDPDKGKLRRGTGSKDAGGCRRLIEYLEQINLTYDIYWLDDTRLLSMLPREFSAFVRQSRSLFN